MLLETFFTSNQKEYDLCKKIVEETVAREGLSFIGWRKVPITKKKLTLVLPL